MKILKHPVILNISIVLALAGAVLFSYHTYFQAHGYVTAKRSADLPLLLDNIASVLRKINDERLKSAGYLATHTKNRFESVVIAREEADQALLTLDSYVKKNPAVTSYSTRIDDVRKALRHVRKEVERLNANYRDILFHGYHEEVFAPFAYLLTDLVSKQDAEVLKRYLLTYETVITLQENTVLEMTGIYYILLQKSPMSREDRLIWDQLIAKDRAPQFHTLPDSIAAVDLRALMSAEAYAQLLSEERKLIEQDANSSRYRVSVVDWLEKTGRKIDYFAQVESLLHTQIEKKVQENIAASKKLLTVYGSAALLLWLLLLRLLFLHSKRAKNKKLYKETQRDIELVFDKKQQKQLKRLIEEGNLNLIYKFLLKAIEDANRTKDLFLASMSHEIRTPLNGILGFTQLLKETGMTEEQKEFISVIEKSSEHLLTIVNDILDLSKIKAQKIELEHIAFDPVERFETAIESYAAKAVKERIDFHLFVDPELPTALIGDPTKISQILVNLVSNAIKFTSENGEVRIAIEKVSETQEDVRISFSVTDTGIGITAEQRKTIFEAFAQADVSTSRKYGGTGLGLSISGRLVDLMGGKLGIRSVKDEGSTFYFTLDLKKAEGAGRRVVDDMSGYTVGVLDAHIGTEYEINRELEAYIAYTGATIRRYTDESLLAIEEKSELPDILFIDHKFRQRGGEIEKFLDIDTRIIVLSTGDQKRNLKRYGTRIDKILYKPVNFTKTLKALSDKEEGVENEEQIRFENIHVLVAEDNPINQKLIINVLNRLGVEVSIANNGQEALEERMAHSYDMIFMDIEMPVMGGMEATGKILSYEHSSGREHVPIIALTANALSGDRERYLGAGMDGYLSKPIELDALRGILKSYFEERIAA